MKNTDLPKEIILLNEELHKFCRTCNRLQNLYNFRHLPSGRICKDCEKSTRKSQRKDLRYTCLIHYSKGTLQCACCGERITRFLTIDHINNGGTVHRRQMKTSSTYLWLMKNNFPEGFQVLCYNCNCGRAANGGVCPHQERKLTCLNPAYF